MSCCTRCLLLKVLPVVAVGAFLLGFERLALVAGAGALAIAMTTRFDQPSGATLTIAPGESMAPTSFGGGTAGLASSADRGLAPATVPGAYTTTREDTCGA